MANELNRISQELRTRIKKQILDPLEILEQVPQGRSDPKGAIGKVFKDFREVNAKIWDDVILKTNKRR
jgi:hypothetical protein